MAEPVADIKPSVTIPQVIAVGAFADVLGVPVTRVIGELMRNGVMATINEQIDYDTAAIIGSDLGFEVVAEAEPEALSERQSRPVLAEGEGQVRPPIVAVMGHVDHGKTSLLDAIREADVAKGESGGITQHIGAYQIKRGDRWITFLDTPGHEAFSALRAHGARMTDVAIIVVAADDGVKPQTREAVRHAQEAGVQIVVAINKIDKEGADPVRVRTELTELGLQPEDWGGKTVTVEVSAKTGANIEQLLDMVLLVADIEDLRARYEGPADGVVVESHVETGRGPVATLLLRGGTLHNGDYLVSGTAYGKLRSLEDWHGRKLQQATPGMPAIVSGLKAVPAFGEVFNTVDSEKAARDQAAAAMRRDQAKSMVRVKKIDAAQLADAIKAGDISELNVVVKADVQGSLESLLESLNQLRNDEVAVRVVSSGVGDINESDINFAKAAGALILGFNVAFGSAVKQLATREQVIIRPYKVIYELLDDIREALSQMMAPEIVETVVGRLDVLGVFKVTKTAVVCGGKVTEGRLVPKLALRVYRGKELIGEGILTSLQKDKQVAREVVEGEICGMEIAFARPVEVGDKIEFYTTESRARSL